MHKNDITYSDKIGELHLDVRHPQNKGKVFLLVEGESDQKLYRKLYDSAVVKIEPIPGGKGKIEEGLRTLLHLHKLVIGIRDADFIHLNNAFLLHENLFVTDHHDLEMTMASEDEVFSSVLCEYCEDEKSKHQEIKNRLLEVLSFIGYFRWYSEANNMLFKFDTFSMKEVINFSSFELDRLKLIETIILQSPDSLIKDKNALYKEIELFIESNPVNQLLQLCNGHDLMKIIALYTQHYSSPQKPKVNDKTIAAGFRQAYSLRHFKQTRLYADTNMWAFDNHCQIYGTVPSE